jgi:hypothetical protein
MAAVQYFTGNNQPKTRGHCDGGGIGYAAHRARSLGEHDGNYAFLAEGDDGDDDKYGKDGNIPYDEDKYAVGVDGVDKPLDKGDDKCDTLSAAPARACPVSQWPSMPSR